MPDRLGTDTPVLVILAAGRARRYGGVKPLAPVGPAGESVLDLLASDALAAGFETLVVVVGSATGEAIRYHVKRTWPTSVDVRFALQEVPLGTVHAVLSSADHIATGTSFGVANADDIYGVDALGLLRQALPESPNALVAFRLSNATIGSGPVTRGVCQVSPGGALRAIHERRGVTRLPTGAFEVADGVDPSRLDPDTLVSTNLWGFGPGMRAIFEEAMDQDLSASDDAEVLLPDVVASAITRSVPEIFRVVPTESRCIGVTHPGDLALVQADLARQIGSGARPAGLWSAVSV